LSSTKKRPTSPVFCALTTGDDVPPTKAKPHWSTDGSVSTGGERRACSGSG
jgi:hypothetical protein